MTDLVFRTLSLEEIRTVYYSDMVFQFPDQERRSYGNIASLIARGIYAGYGLFENGDLHAYALAALFPERHAVLLDYLAAMQSMKGKGYGSAILSRLRSYFDNTDRILIETEDPDVLEDEERSIAERRLGFYTRNGYHETGVQMHLFSVWYRLYVDDAHSDTDEELMELMKAIYGTIVPPALYAKNVHLQVCKEG